MYDEHSEHLGKFFRNRMELYHLGLHIRHRAGISGNKAEGAAAIVLSGGYEDDIDNGDTITYTGEGGRDPKTGRQVRDQKMHLGNLWLRISCNEGLPVRVIRSVEDRYRYDGLHRIVSQWHDRPKTHGHLIFRYQLEPIDSSVVSSRSEEQGNNNPVLPKRVTYVTNRIIRETKLGRRVKEDHDYTCQICRVQLQASEGAYAEAAHIRPLGLGHNGPDKAENILCLCPNHHVQFDQGVLGIDNNYKLLGFAGELRMVTGHNPDPEHLAYHRSHIYNISDKTGT